MKRCLAIIGLIWCFCAGAAEVMPPVPSQYFNDYANVVSPGTADKLNRALESFEKETSSQVLVAIYPTMQSDSSIEDYTTRVYESWKPGQKGRDNGAILFVFVNDHRMRIQVGYGLEGALPDALCKRILDTEIAPRFKAGDFDGGVTAGVNAILAATQGEYKGTGQTVAQSQHAKWVFREDDWILFFVIVIVSLNFMLRRRGGGGGWTIGGGGFGGGYGGGWSGGGGGGFGGGGGGGGFSGGGGSTGGGGASGSW